MMLWRIVYLAVGFAVIIYSPVLSQQTYRFSQETWLKRLIDEKQYDRFVAPGQHERDQTQSESSEVSWKTTEVKVEFYIESIGNYEASTMDYDLDVYFREFWVDPRLQHNQSVIFFNDRKLIDRLWRPDLYFANSKEAKYNDVTLANCIFRVYGNGSITYSVRISLKLSCHMNLKAYPIDTQRCYVKMLPYGSTVQKVDVDWRIGNESVLVNPEIVESDLKMTANLTQYCKGVYYGEKYSCLLVEFILHRDLGSSLFQTYLPTTFIVIISWISFWIDPSSVPGRVGLAVTTLLTLSTQSAGIRLQLPPVSYAKALDVWLGVCQIFLFGVLVEFAIVNMYSRKASNPASVLPKTKKRKKDVSILHDKNDMASPHLLDENEDVDDIEKVAEFFRSKAQNIDSISRILFPIVFFAFCVAYWGFYLGLRT